MNGHGGAREGAGRPRKAEKYAGQIAAAEDRIADRLPELVDRAFELAVGVQAVRWSQHGEKVYDTPPCIKAIAFLFERIAGKATQAVELNNGESGPLKIVVEYADARDPAEDAEAPPGPGEDPPGAEAV